jgi:hypothetical protein
VTIAQWPPLTPPWRLPALGIGHNSADHRVDPARRGPRPHARLPAGVTMLDVVAIISGPARTAPPGRRVAVEAGVGAGLRPRAVRFDGPAARARPPADGVAVDARLRGGIGPPRIGRERPRGLEMGGAGADPPGGAGAGTGAAGRACPPGDSADAAASPCSADSSATIASAVARTNAWKASPPSAGQGPSRRVTRSAPRAATRSAPSAAPRSRRAR